MQQLISTPVLGNWETALRVVRTILERHSPDVFSEIRFFFFSYGSLG